MQLVKISENRLQKSGKNGNVISLPKVFIQDNKIEYGSTLEWFRTWDADTDILVLKVKRTSGANNAAK